jgi:glycerol uptake facilitator-like aquaporin
VAEFLGTMFLVLVGCGSCIGGDVDFVRIALAFGVTVATMAQAVGHISGCHINPAVTAGLLFGRKIGIIKAILYIIIQCAGALVGAGLLLVRQC